jgi:hypothetical protein
VVLGGSHARGGARPDSDIDLGLLYSEAEPFSLAQLRSVAEAVNDTPSPTVSDFYGWGRWVNGGVWLTVKGQRVDFLHRSIEHVLRTIGEAESGRYEMDFAQHPPFGFFGPTYLGEVAICVPQWEAQPDTVGRLKRRVAVFPERLWSATFGLEAFASKLLTLPRRPLRSTS